MSDLKGSLHRTIPWQELPRDFDSHSQFSITTPKALAIMSTISQTNSAFIMCHSKGKGTKCMSSVTLFRSLFLHVHVYMLFTIFSVVSLA